MKKFLPYLLAIVAVIAVMGIYWDTGAIQNPYDDSFLTYRYAVNLAEGHGLVFNTGGERTDAASSFLYTVVLAGVYRLGWHDIEKVSFILNMLALGLIAAFVYLSVLRLSGQWWAGVALCLIASLHGFTSSWVCLGMETTCFTALLVVWTYFTFITPRKWVSFALTAALVLFRPEGVLVVPFWFIAFRDWRGLAALMAGIGIFYTVKYAYYNVWISHAFTAKGILKYYAPNPMQILYTWKAFALFVPTIAIAGCIMEKRVRWLGLFIAIFVAACLLGPKSDFCRYACPLLPLMLIVGAPVFRRWYFAPLILSALLFQGYNSILYMRYQCAYLAPIQECRARAGEWLEANADCSRPVLSGDIGSIAYHAPSIRFIDTIGLTSKDVLAAYKRGDNLDAIIAEKRPYLIADTFGFTDGILMYMHGDAAFVKNGKPSNIPEFRPVWGERFGMNLAIAIAEVR